MAQLLHIISICIILQLDNYFRKPYYQVFLPFWVYYVLYAFFILYQTVKLIRLLLNKLKQKQSDQQILVSFWIVFQHSVMYFITFYGVYNMLAFDFDGKLQHFSNSNKLVLAVFLSNFVLNLFLFSFVRNQFYFETKTSYMQLNQSSNVELSKNSNQSFDWQKVPRYLVKLSTNQFKKDDKQVLKQNGKGIKNVNGESEALGEQIQFNTRSRQSSKTVQSVTSGNHQKSSPIKQPKRKEQAKKSPQSSLTQSSNSDSKCSECSNSPADCIMVPCLHGGVCYECAVAFWERQNCCHQCGEEIQQLLQVDTRNQDKDNRYKVLQATQLL